MAQKNENSELVYDAAEMSLGRISSIAAKSALMNNDVIIINCEKAVVTGRKRGVLEQFKAKRERGEPFNGPFYPRMPDQIVKRTIRGMIPWKKSRGRDAYKRIKCYIGVPDKFKDKKIVKITYDNIKKHVGMENITVGEISYELGARWE